MENPLNHLQEDHRNFLRLLALLRTEVGKYDDTEKETDLNLLLEAIAYLRDYPHNFHHPLEEAAFAYMLEHGFGDRDIIEKIQEQHEELEAKTAELQQLFELISSDQVVPINQIKETVNSYLDKQFKHLKTEDEAIFPAMAEHLDDAAWEEITRNIEQHTDELFRGNPAPYPELDRQLKG